MSVTLQIWTGSYPAIPANDITINVYEQSNPAAIVGTLTHPAPHLADTWVFGGLNRVNLLFRIYETLAGSGGATIVRQLGDDMNVVPGSQGGVNFRATEQIEADVTVGFTSGVNIVTFDGTGGKEDWRGWDIDTLNRMGSIGDMKKGVDYSWNKTLGQLVLLIVSDVFGPNEWFNVQFAAQVGTSTDSPAQVVLFTTPKKITANYNVLTGDFGGLLIIDPAGVYLELQLPVITTVVPGRVLEIEMRRAGVFKCAKIITDTGKVIDWLEGGLGHLHICPNESIQIYRWTDPAGPTDQWRVRQPIGNWIRLGEHVTDDNEAANVFNKQLFDGSDMDVFATARFYNDYVLNLPGGRAVNYDDWAIGNNKYFYSLANSANPLNANKYKMPDFRNAFFRMTDGARLPGVWQVEDIGPHAHEQQTFSANAGGEMPRMKPVGFSDVLDALKPSGYLTSLSTGTETRPANRTNRIYCVL